MKKFRFIFIFLFAIMLIFICKGYCYADTDEITDYVVTVDPRMTDRNFRYYL